MDPLEMDPKPRESLFCEWDLHDNGRLGMVSTNAYLEIEIFIQLKIFTYA